MRSNLNTVILALLQSGGVGIAVRVAAAPRHTPLEVRDQGFLVAFPVFPGPVGGARVEAIWGEIRGGPTAESSRRSQTTSLGINRISGTRTHSNTVVLASLQS